MSPSSPTPSTTPTPSPTPRRRRRRSAGALGAAAAAALLVSTGLLGTGGTGLAAPAVRADYQLQGTRTSVVGTPPALQDTGTAGSFATATVDGVPRTVFRHPRGGGLRLTPAVPTVAAGTWTVAMLWKPDDVAGAYHRVLDLRGGVGDAGFYERGGALYAYPSASSSTTPITSTAFSQVVVTRTSGKVVTGYVNGKKVLSFTDSSDAFLASDDLRFGKDNTGSGATGEETGGQWARIRLWNAPLAAADVAALDRLPASGADLRTTYVDAPDPVQRGAALAYVATVANAGPSTAPATKVTLTVPSGTAFTASSPSTGSCAAPVSGKVVCTLGDLPAGAAAQVLLVLRAPTAAGSTSSTATASSTAADPRTADNAATQGTTVR